MIERELADERLMSSKFRLDDHSLKIPGAADLYDRDFDEAFNRPK